MRQQSHKALAIVYTASKPRRFLTVRDRRFGDWTFVCGGCRKREIFFPLKTALRELHEETRGLLTITHATYRYFYFVDGEYPNSLYHCYMIELDMPVEAQINMERDFRHNKMISDERRRNRLAVKRSHDECTALSWDTWQQFTRKRRWPLITRSVINSQRFYDCLNDTNGLLEIPFDYRSVRNGNSPLENNLTSKIVEKEEGDGEVEMEGGSSSYPHIDEGRQVLCAEKRSESVL